MTAWTVTATGWEELCPLREGSIELVTWQHPLTKNRKEWTNQESYTIKKEEKVKEVWKKMNVMAENGARGKHKVSAHLCVLQLGIVDLWDKLIGRLPQLFPWLILLYPVGLTTGTRSTPQIDEQRGKKGNSVILATRGRLQICSSESLINDIFCFIFSPVFNTFPDLSFQSRPQLNKSKKNIKECVQEGYLCHVERERDYFYRIKWWGEVCVNWSFKIDKHQSQIINLIKVELKKSSI